MYAMGYMRPVVRSFFILALIAMALEGWRGHCFHERGQRHAKCQRDVQQWLGITLEFWCMTRKTHPDIP